jgi:hypothetical protein
MCNQNDQVKEDEMGKECRPNEETRIACRRILVLKLEVKRPVRRPRSRWVGILNGY